MDSPGLVLVPGEISGVRTSFVVKVGHLQESEKHKVRQKKSFASVRQKGTRFEGRSDWSGVGLKSDCHGVSTTGGNQEKVKRELEQTQQTGQQ